MQKVDSFHGYGDRYSERLMNTVLVVVMSTISLDNRVLRQIEALKNNHRVLTIGFGPPPKGAHEHISIPVELAYLPLNLSALIPHLFGNYKKSSQNTAAIRFVRESVCNLTFDLVIVNDVATLPLVHFIDKPVIADMHEYAPLELEHDWRFRIFLKRYNFWLCKKYLPKVKAVTTVSHGLANRYEFEFGVQVSVIYNAREQCQIKVRESTNLNLKLVHTGLAAKARQLEVMIEAVKAIPHMTLDLYLVEAPYQTRTIKRLTTLAQKTNNVRILSPVKSELIPELISDYDLALIYVASDQFTLRYGMPNKLFDCVQARVGVVLGPSPEMSDFCLKKKIGVSTSKFDAGELATLLRAIEINVVNEFKLNCERVAKEINAETEGAKFLAIVENEACKIKSTG
jgi:Glycosyltransferase Family 4